MGRRLLMPVLAAGIGLPPGLAAAATRTVCFEFQIAEDRSDCASGSTTGNLRGCGAQGDLVDAIGHAVELWDKDASGGDDYIGAWIKANSGRGCATFEWENAAYSHGEANPDVYVKYNQKVRRSDGTQSPIQGLDAEQTMPVTTSWRDGDGVDADAYVAVDCTTGADCDIYPSGALVPTFDYSSTRGQRILALDSAQHSLEAFGADLSGTIDLWYPCDLASTISPCPATGAKTQTLVQFKQSDGSAASAFVVSHEIGHVVQMQAFGQDTLVADCSYGGNTHQITSTEYESCATTEGWADFVAIASWWDVANSSSAPYVYGGYWETALPTNQQSCGPNAKLELQVARGFWDLADTNNESGEVPASYNDGYSENDLAYIAEGWSQFSNGTANHQNDESDVDGVNLRDYQYNNSGRFGVGFFDTLLNHNCTGSQDSG